MRTPRSSHKHHKPSLATWDSSDRAIPSPNLADCGTAEQKQASRTRERSCGPNERFEKFEKKKKKKKKKKKIKK
jgi:hypothetical protein